MRSCLKQALTTALYLLPLGIKRVKKLQFGYRSVTLMKAEISKCFILHIEESQNLQEEQKKFESWLQDGKQEVLPYLILFGKLESPQIYIVINSENYVCQDILKTVESCYKSLTALHTILFICDFVWSFIEKAVYNFTPKKSNSWVSKFILDMNKK